MTKNLPLAALAAAATLAAPAAASADTSLVAGPVKHKGYDLTITATDGAKDSVSVTAVKRAGQSTQMHLWSLDGASVSIKGAKATIKGSFGAFGRLDGKVTAGRRAKGVVPAGCKGTPGSARAGTMTGRTKLALDGSFFRTFAPKAMKAQILTGGRLECGGGAGTTPQGGLTLLSTAEAGGATLMVSATKDASGVTQTVTRMDAPAGAVSGMHFITAKAGAAGLDAAADLSSATAKAAGPFLSGTLQFAGESLGTMATGTVSGDFAAKFDGIGTQTLPAGNDGMLTRR